MSIQVFPLNDIKYQADQESQIAEFCQPSFTNINYTKTSSTKLTINKDSGVTNMGKYFLFETSQVFDFPTSVGVDTTYYIYVAYDVQTELGGGVSQVYMTSTSPGYGNWSSKKYYTIMTVWLAQGSVNLNNHMTTQIDLKGVITENSNFNLVQQNYVGQTKSLPDLNLNNVFQAGSYIATGSMSNAPYVSGMLFVNTRGFRNDISQIFHSEKGELFTRYFDKSPTNAWTKWEQYLTVSSYTDNYSTTNLYNNSVGQSLTGNLKIGEAVSNFDTLVFVLNTAQGVSPIRKTSFEILTSQLNATSYVSGVYADLTSLDGVGSRFKTIKLGATNDVIAGYSSNGAGGQLLCTQILGKTRIANDSPVSTG